MVNVWTSYNVFFVLAHTHTSDCNCMLLVVGHITGRHDSHRTLTACPLYHNMSADECKVLSVIAVISVCSSAGWAIHINWSKCLCSVCLDIPGCHKSYPLHTDTWNLACTDLLMNPDPTVKTRSVWPSLGSKLLAEKCGRE